MAALVASPVITDLTTPSIRSDLKSATSTVICLTAPVEQSSPRLSFLSFPPEVRNQIYTYLFQDSKLGISTVHSGTPLGNPKNNRAAANTINITNGTTIKKPSCGTFCSCSFPWGIIYTCRLLRHETTSLLLSSTTLEVTSRLEKTLLLPEAFVSAIQKIVILDARVLVTLVSQSQQRPPSSPAPASTSSSAATPHLQSFTFTRFPRLHTLELRNIRVWCKYYQESYLESPAADSCMFNLAMFNLRRISPALVALCENSAPGSCTCAYASTSSDGCGCNEGTGYRGFRILLDCQFVGNSTRHETVQAVIDVDERRVLSKSRGASGVGSRNAWAGFY